MRRVLLFAAFLLLLGLTTATAASFDVQAEDITSFSQAVDIDVPDPPVRPGSYFLRGQRNEIPGFLDDQPTGSDPVRTKEVQPGSGTVQSQADTDFFHNWEVVAGSEGIHLAGPAVLRIYQNGGADRVTARLFNCPSDAGLTSGSCAPIAVADATNPADGATGYTERAVDFGPITVDIDPGRRLRVQIANLAESTAKWSVQWGFKSNRPSRLDVTLAGSV